MNGLDLLHTRHGAMMDVRLTGGLCLFIAGAVLIASCRRQNVSHESGDVKVENAVDALEDARPFGLTIGWLAIRSSSPTEVMARLGIRDGRRTAWKQGVEDAYEKHDASVVYVTPPIEGWVLVAGTSMFSYFGKTKADEAREPERIAALSITLDSELQYFATHRNSNSHTWIRCLAGNVIRAYSIGDGEVIFDIGAVTEGERALGINFDSSDDFPTIAPSPENKHLFLEWASHQVDEQMVTKVAGQWSVNPDVEGRRLPQGWAGTLLP